jgi:hypothetical protein
MAGSLDEIEVSLRAVAIDAAGRVVDSIDEVLSFQ